LPVNGERSLPEESSGPKRILPSRHQAEGPKARRPFQQPSHNLVRKPVQSGCSVGRPYCPNVTHQRLAEETFVFAGDPVLRVEDFYQVTDYLTILPDVDEDRIGVLGICGGGGYSINAAMTERRIKAVGTVTGANYGRLMREGFSGYDPIGALEKMARQRTAEARGAKPRVDDLLPPSPQEAKKLGITDVDMLGATEYYRTPRGQKPKRKSLCCYLQSGGDRGFEDAPDRCKQS